MAHLGLLVTALLAVSCGQATSENKNTGSGDPPPPLAQNPTPPNGPEEATKADPLTGSFTGLDGNTIELGAVSDKPAVIYFAQDTCSLCAQEATELAHFLDGRQPINVHLVTIVIGSNAIDTDTWRQHFEPQPAWTVGFTEDGSLVRSYFGGIEVPAVVVYDPRKGVVAKQIGGMSITDLEALTGKWEIEQ